MRDLFKPRPASAALAAALVLSACGGGGDAPAPATVPAPPPSAAMHQQAVALAEAVYAFGDMTMGPIWYGTDVDVKVLAPTDVCASGSMSSRLNGAAVVAGTLLPTGSHTFDATFSACAVLPTVTLTGSASIAYNAAQSIVTGVNATATANGVRWQGTVTPFTGTTPVSVDYTGSGAMVFTYNESAANNVLTSEGTLRPLPGATLTGHASRSTLTWVSGELREVVLLNATTGAPTAYTAEYRALTFSVGGTQVVVDGTLTKTFSGNAMTPGGQATLRVAGTQVGTLRFAADGRLTPTLTADVPAF